MKLLRKVIQKYILESYELTDTDVATIQKDGRFMRGVKAFDKEWPEEKIRKQYDRRGQGYQGIEPTKRDINVMKQFNQMLNSTPEGKQIIKDFQSGRIQILHSIEYQGIESDKREYQTSKVPFTSWLNRYGKTGKDMISVVASPMKYHEHARWEDWPEQWNAFTVYEQGYGFLMKGYPAFIAYEDVMSQTLTALPQSLKDFQKNSGVSKRAGDLSSRIKFEDWFNGIGSEETLLDNWTVIGIFIGLENDGNEDLIRNAKATGLPVYQVDMNKGLVKIK